MKRFVVRADEKLTAFLELDAAITTRDAGALMAERLWNDEYLIGPRIFCFAAGWVAAYVNVSPLCVEGTKDVSGLARHRLSRWKHGFGRGGSERGWRGAWFYL